MSTEAPLDPTGTSSDIVAAALKDLVTRHSLGHLTAPGMAAALLRDELGPNGNDKSYRRQIEGVDAAVRHGIATALADDASVSRHDLVERLARTGMAPAAAAAAVDAWSAAVGRGGGAPTSRRIEKTRDGSDAGRIANLDDAITEARRRSGQPPKPPSAPDQRPGRPRQLRRTKRRMFIAAAAALLIAAVIGRIATEPSPHRPWNTTTTVGYDPSTTTPSDTTTDAPSQTTSLADFVRVAQSHGFNCTRILNTSLQHVYDMYHCTSPDGSYFDDYVQTNLSYGDSFVEMNFVDAPSSGSWSSGAGKVCGNRHNISFRDGSTGTAYTFSSVDIVILDYGTNGSGPDSYFPAAACQ